MSLRNPDTAVRHLTEAIRLNPNIALTHFNLALIFKSKGMTEEAVTHFREALRVKPNWEQPMNSLAWILATHNNPKVRDPQEAVNLARQACELTDYQNPGFLDTLAAAYAAAGRFSDAVSTAEKALQIIASGDKKKRALAVQNRLDLYRQQKTYRQP
jgi:Flp pilus assembly protein TadD